MPFFNKSTFNSKKLVLPFLVVLFGLSLGLGATVLAEQLSGTPESGVTSRIKQVYDDLVSKGQGSDSSGSWGDWGAYWNRIRSVVIDYSLQSLQTYDDYASAASSEEGSWTQINASPEIWQDERTGLYWSESQGTQASGNQFVTTCDFFSSDPRGSYAGTDPNCGAAINQCADLTDGGYTDWYLPTQKELQQAYINGIYNQTSGSFATTSSFWSSTEQSNGSSYAWRVTLYSGYTITYDKTSTSFAVRCVRRD